METTELTDEQIEQHFEESFGSDETARNDTPEEPELEPASETAELSEPEPEPEPEPESGITFQGNTYSQTEADEIFNVYRWAQSLTPGQVQAIDAALTGQFVTANEPEPEPSPEVSSESDEYLDPKAETEIAALNQRIAELDEKQQTQAMQAQEAQIAEAEAGITLGETQFRDKWGLSVEETSQLEEQVVRMGIFPQMVQQADSYAEATENAFEIAFWNHPELRQRATQFFAAEQSDVAREKEARKTRAGAVSASGGTMPRTEPEPSTYDQRQKAMISELKQHM